MQSIYNPNQILNTANSFFFASQRCNEKKPIQNGTIQWLAVPVIVNSALACELYMKAILCKKGISFEREHRLADLFGELPSEEQTIIIKKCDRAEFEQKLNAVSKAFTEWRYIYEHETMSIDIAFLQNFLDEIRKLAEQIITDKS